MGISYRNLVNINGEFVLGPDSNGPGTDYSLTGLDPSPLIDALSSGTTNEENLEPKRDGYELRRSLLLLFLFHLQINRTT